MWALQQQRRDGLDGGEAEPGSPSAQVIA